MKAANDTVPRRIGRVAVGVLAAVVVVGTVVTWSLLRSADKVDQLSTGYGPAADANAAALTYMLDVETAIRGYALTGGPASLGPYHRAIDQVLPSIDAERAAVHSVGDGFFDSADHARAPHRAKLARPDRTSRGAQRGRRPTRGADDVGGAVALRHLPPREHGGRGEAGRDPPQPPVFGLRSTVDVDRADRGRRGAARAARVRVLHPAHRAIGVAAAHRAVGGHAPPRGR